MESNGTNYSDIGILMETVTSAPDNDHVTTDFLMGIRFTCEHILMPIVCCVGICGNALSLCVLTRKEMTSTTMCFLTALAISDLLLLILQIPAFFGLDADVASRNCYKRFFRIYTVIRYVMNNIFITCTSWLTVVVAAERFISLRFMFNPKLVCTIKKARLVITGIFLLSFIFHFSKFFEYLPNPDLNSTLAVLGTPLVHNPSYDTYVHIANILLAAVIPLFLLVLVNSFLIYFLAMHRRRMLRHKTSASYSMISVDMLHVSVIVVATVLIFVLCHSVGVFMALTIASKGRQWVFERPSYIVLNYINTVLVMFNSSVNFFLYCAISRKFRKTLLKKFQRRL